jgi:hypothetical protein
MSDKGQGRQCSGEGCAEAEKWEWDWLGGLEWRDVYSPCPTSKMAKPLQNSRCAQGLTPRSANKGWEDFASTTESPPADRQLMWAVADVIGLRVLVAPHPTHRFCS